MPVRNHNVGGEVDWIGIAEAQSALAWWLDAGVDVAIQEDARDWLKPAREKPPVAAEAPAPEARPAHDTLEQFQDWLSTARSLPMASASARRVLPQGSERAEVLLLAEAPEDSSAPLSGDAWQLAARMLAAIGFQENQSYSASLSYFHAPGVRMSPADREACAEIARRHVALAKPKRLLLLGDGPCTALLGKRLVEARSHIHKVEGVRAVATFHPRHLINRPLDKSLAWKDLLLLMEEES
jgi:DNA polymerase